MSTKTKLSTHVLDTSIGRPAAGLFVELYKQKSSEWILWHNTVTSTDGRIQFPFTEDSLQAATYKLKFNIEQHYKKCNVDTLYPYIEVSRDYNPLS